MPTLSIILPTYNGSRFIQEAILSVERQTYTDWELIIIDDGSEDDTKKIIQSYIEKDPRIIYIQQKNQGQGVARKHGIKLSKGTYIALLDDDDVWKNERKLEHQISFLKNNPDHVLVGAATTLVIDENGTFLYTYMNPEKDPDIREQILLKNCFTTSSVIFSKKAYKAVGGFSHLRLSEDYDLWLRMGQVGKMANIKNAETLYRKRKSSSSGRRKLKLCKNTLMLVYIHKTHYAHSFRALAKGVLRFIYYLPYTFLR